MHETELYNFIIDSLYLMFGLNEDRLYKYLKLKYLILEKENNKLSFAKFILSELNIPLEENNYFIFNGIKIGIYTEMFNILENWEFRASLVPEHLDLGKTQQILTLEAFINETYLFINTKAKNKTNRITENKAHKNLYKKNYGIKYLNEFFNIIPSPPKMYLEITYPLTHNPYKRTIEEELESRIHAIEFKSNNINLISEKDLENYLILNMDKIEKGMTYIDRQVIVDGGIIDIIGKDKDEVITIIELKVEEDKKIIWQCLHYPKIVKEKYRTDKVRLITLMPEYNESLKAILQEIEEVEMKKYKVKLKNGKITDIHIIDEVFL